MSPNPHQSPYGKVFNQSVGDISMEEILEENNFPVIDLRCFEPVDFCKGKTRFFDLFFEPYLKLTQEQQARVLFIGNKQDVYRTLLLAPNAKDALLNNPCIQHIVD